MATNKRCVVALLLAMCLVAAMWSEATAEDEQTAAATTDGESGSGVGSVDGEGNSSAEELQEGDTTTQQDDKKDEKKDEKKKDEKKKDEKKTDEKKTDEKKKDEKKKDEKKKDEKKKDEKKKDEKKKDEKKEDEKKEDDKKEDDKEDVEKEDPVVKGLCVVINILTKLFCSSDWKVDDKCKDLVKTVIDLGCEDVWV